ncbi:clathrin adaptor, mu subunit [Eremomyces bilateralis CBS 781.70]|uniref:Clathrin adaptor, mu subunit n=1 Tax=Eremomyces bilateralis CBS 781.70 TaxID=1392243 RepID=A0A6G1FQV1_9PEZI|nr:clathrin adaptor, mu subunit [Eremomyces bilateralis CBS 781.70]KAF1808108.1 clathrin adaptor, mu subunit [Eremomyces bilateralis CBS 781.70]
MGTIDVVYIFDEHNTLLLSHHYHGSPPSAKVLLNTYLSHSSPRPSVLYVPSTHPPCILCSMVQDRLLFLTPLSHDMDPLIALEFLHRVADALEEFLGSPLLASRIETQYDVVAQLLGEMCDAGIMSVTEPNALRDLVDVGVGLMGKFLGGVGLPRYIPSSLEPQNNLSKMGLLTLFEFSASPSLSSAPGSSLSFKPPGSDTNQLAIPWRRANVRHTSNELYVDIVESVTAILAPSGRPLAARAHGTIVFTAKVSGVPDLILQLTTPGGRMNVAHTMQLPVFHPCVRLARWKEHPGELSFVPPDGRFVLAGYEVDLLGADYLTRAMHDPNYRSDLHLPVSIELNKSLGPDALDFEVKMSLDLSFVKVSSSSSTGLGAGLGRAKSAGLRPSTATSGTSAQPTLEEIVVSVPIPSGVRNFSEMKASRGEATYAPGDGTLEWRIYGKEASMLMNGVHSVSGGVVATLRCSVVGQPNVGEVEEPFAPPKEKWDYDEGGDDAYQAEAGSGKSTGKKSPSDEKLSRIAAKNAELMPSSASVSFQVKGWLPSGIKVEKLAIDMPKSKGIGAGVQPYKGVKYLAVSKGGVEIRC